jgi:hypothetical protein
MTIKEAILKSLEDLQKLVDSNEVCSHILSKQYCNFAGKTPASTVSAQLGDFIRNSDIRVKRIKQSNGIYLYYLSKDEERMGIDLMYDEAEIDSTKISKTEKKKNYEERDLHKLLSSYLKNTDIYSKTIFHEQSNGKDSNQIWTHPDMVGIKFLSLQTKASQNFLKSINRVDTFKLSSYEIKREVNNDSELKKAYFQAVSNSSWANFGYLVAFEFSDSLYEEMSRLNQSFGIGIIELNSNPYQSKILFTAKYRDLDFKTIDKLCKINKEFEKFIEQTEKLMTAEERYYKSTEKELDEFCDNYFMNDTEVEKYCKEKHIPTEQDLT